MVWIGKYRRRDGIEVKAHSRWAAGARREVAIFVGVAAVILGGGSAVEGARTSDGTGGADRPRPQQSAVYPVHFPGWEAPKKPKPTVSYPIKFSARGGEQ